MPFCVLFSAHFCYYIIIMLSYNCCHGARVWIRSEWGLHKTGPPSRTHYPNYSYLLLSLLWILNFAVSAKVWHSHFTPTCTHQLNHHHQSISTLFSLLYEHHITCVRTIITLLYQPIHRAFLSSKTATPLLNHTRSYIPLPRPRFDW